MENNRLVEMTKMSFVPLRKVQIQHMQSLQELIWRDSQTSNAGDDLWRTTAKRRKILKWLGMRL